MRILSYNVRYFGHATRGIMSTRGAMIRIARAVASLEPVPEVVCLQEVETTSFRSNIAHRSPDGETQLEKFMGHFRDALADLGKEPGYQAFYFPAHVYGSGNLKFYTTGLALIVHPEIAVGGHNAHAPHDITHRRSQAVRRLKQTRICAHARLVHPTHGPFEIFNTHFSLPSAFRSEFWTLPKRMGFGTNQLAEAHSLRAFIEQERKSERFIVVGDFNSLGGSPVYRYLVGDAGLVDAFSTHHQLDEEGLNRFATAGFLNLRMRLDHLFSGKGVTWLDFDETHPVHAEASRFRGLSDHMPLIGRFALR